MKSTVSKILRDIVCTNAILFLLVLGKTTVLADTFNPAHYLADPEITVLNKTVANQQFGRDLFGNPWATVVVGNVDVYDRFPYLEARYFQIVSDPAWDRLLLGEIGKAPAAFDGAASTFGHLSQPRGLSCDEANRVYVADTGNNRVLVFQANSEFDRMTLEPLYAIEDLSKPYDVAYSDNGTPYEYGDDRLYVANSGRNEVRLYALSGNSATLRHTIGELGSGVEHFAGPLALTVGHHQGVHSRDVIVSDAHNGRLVHLIDTGEALAWQGAVPHGLGTVTSLDSDHWGNIYAAAPHSGGIVKYTASLMRVARYDGGVNRPRSFHVPFANVTDHRSGQVTRKGQGGGVLVESWSGESGMQLLNLGVEMSDATVVEDNGTTVRMTLTDHADVTAVINDPKTGEVIARHHAGVLAAGPQTVRFANEDFVSPWQAREYRVTLTASSTYDDAVLSEIAVDFLMGSAGTPALPEHLTTLGNSPNPFNPSTTIRFTVPAGASRDYTVRIYDVAGRLVRSLDSGRVSSGLKQVTWDGRNDRGDYVGSGVYLYRIDVGSERISGKMVMVK